MSFHEIQFPPRLSLGSAGGPERLTEVVTLTNGHEERNTPWAHSRRRYDAGISMRSLDDLHELVAFFEARRGRLFGFRWKDWADFKSCRPSEKVSFEDQEIGTGDGTRTTFVLSKRYRSGLESYDRPIAKPVAETVRIGLDGVEATGWASDPSTGIITFSEAPAENVRITAGYEFDVPVRFDTDAVLVSVTTFEAGEIPDVPIVEVRA
ncbi:MAG: DUF2460 domain-containing protein [Pseudomonadota bacterium]